MTDAARLESILEVLGLEGRPPDTRFFEDLFLRFHRRVAYETLTRPAGDPRAFDPEGFFAEGVEEERGLVGDERALAFAWLAGQLGFTCEVQSSFCFRPWETEERDEQRRSRGAGGFSAKGNGLESHRAVVAKIAGRRILADAGFPLPVLLPLDSPAADIPTAFGALSLKFVEKEQIAVMCDGRGEESELLRLDLAPGGAPLPLEEIRRTLPGASPQLGTGGRKNAFALRVLDDRVLFWRGGRMTILDAWSRLEYPLAAGERAAIGKLFALELEGIALPVEPAAEMREPATLSVFHLSPVAPDEARARVGRDALPLTLVTAREERVEAAAGGSRIMIRTTLADVPPEGPGEAVRKTLVFHLVSELFALARGEGRPS